MKKLVFSFAFIGAAIIANAQSQKKSPSSSMSIKPFRVSIGAEASVPLGSFKNKYSFGFGGSAESIYQVDPTLGLTLNAGLVHYSGKDYTYNVGPVVYTVKDQSLTVIPIMAGIRYSFTPMFYGSAQLGTGIFTKDKNNSASSSSSAFAYAPGIGYKFTDNFDAELKYQSYSKNSVTNSALGLRLAYTF